MLPLFFILVGCCLSLPSDPKPTRLPIPQTDIVPSLSIPGVEIRRPRPFSSAPGAPVRKKHGNIAKLKRLPKSHSNQQPSAAAYFAKHLRSDAAHGAFQTGNVSAIDRSASQYSVEVVLNGSPVHLVLNTGGSDTWVRAKNFTCLNSASDSASGSKCDWGSYGASGFRDGPIYDQHFAVKNQDGSALSGQLGYMDVTLANITVKNQEVAIATQGTWHGDNITSGMLGMAYPSLTSAYSGNDLNDTSDDSALEYPPLFTSMVTDGLVEPYWSIAIDRNSSDGLITLGDLPPTNLVNLSNSHSEHPNLLIAKYQPSYYTAVFDGFKIGNTEISESYPLVLDSATTLAYLPPDVADTVNSHFRPAATYIWYYGSHFVPCNATPPIFSVLIGSSRFEINPVDMIKHDVVDPKTGMCQTGVTSGRDGPYILGLTFLKNVVVGFDMAAGVIDVYSRSHY
ncbi:eukaryotic aspartyl protease [Apiospora saccharicola]|uniref:Eukaryotic aspartyl protease n=1 Tax=Apiospora saccharicola TaxID=335842 RepID=A0ABR1W3R2_9PEZI